jgi:hypothetical protein
MMRWFSGAAAASSAAVEYSVQDFAAVRLQAVAREADPPGPAVPLGDLWKDRGALVMVVRRPG